VAGQRHLGRMMQVGQDDGPFVIARVHRMSPGRSTPRITSDSARRR
jgi:hypothetical protein